MSELTFYRKLADIAQEEIELLNKRVDTLNADIEKLAKETIAE